jgi:hypothetical protein
VNDAGTRQPVLFADLSDRPVVAKFDQPHASSSSDIEERNGPIKEREAIWTANFRLEGNLLS